MKATLRISATLVVSLGLGLSLAAGQTPAAGGTEQKSVATSPGHFDFGLTFTYKIAQITNTNQTRFVLAGGSVDGVYSLRGKARNLGLAFEVSGETASNVEPGRGLSQISFVAGPRHTFFQSKGANHNLSLYGQALIGGVHAFNSTFPNSVTTTTSSASSLAFQGGGGANLSLSKRLGLRLLEADYVMTSLPNSTNGYQGDLRMSNGLTLHF